MQVMERPECRPDMNNARQGGQLRPIFGQRRRGDRDDRNEILRRGRFSFQATGFGTVGNRVGPPARRPLAAPPVVVDKASRALGSTRSGCHPARAFSDEVDAGSSKKMRQDKDLERFAIAARS
ncbi:hypothetical protein mvi_46290 [Methylobacterium indicum]|uniref:Uncharacterized protein n=1 Tax=Methylobacterium indicum TaxID=1775910 RepID=A0A8H8WX70_9HYPH|nr:hypothetical protein mvi_46290 [Methylobacterium indicum]